MQVSEIVLNSNPNSVFSTNINLKQGDKVVVSLSGSLELGTVKAIRPILDEMEMVEFVRIATENDLKINCENCKYSRSLVSEVKKEAQKLNLDMKISFVSSSLDKTKIVINYTSENRVDFRELVKILGSKFKARIEMRQIGYRDESKVVGALGMCGRVTCCKAFLSDFDKVSIKMAKNQNISLNPNRINGMCGRLLCCFKYEDEFYEEMQKKMPKINSFVVTPDGKGEVTATDFLKETVSVMFKNEETTEVKTYPLSEVTKASKN